MSHLCAGEEAWLLAIKMTQLTGVACICLPVGPGGQAAGDGLDGGQHAACAPHAAEADGVVAIL